MDEGADFLEMLDLQGNLNMVTKSELLERVRRDGASISDRQLITYVTEGLVPKLARIGTKTGAYPAIVVELVSFISRARKLGIPVSAVKELLPVWRFLQRSSRDHRLDLAELEYVGRQHITSPEASFALPWMLQEVLRFCPHCGNNLLTVVMRDGQELHPAKGDVVTLGFVLAEMDEDDGVGVVSSSMRMTVPTPVDLNDPGRIVLGVPNGVAVVDRRRRPAADDPEEVGATGKQ